MTISTSIADWVGTIEVEDFSPLSRYDAHFARSLRDAVVELSDDDHVKAIVLRTRGEFAPDVPAAELDPSTLFTSWPQDFAGASALYQAVTFSKKITVTEVAGGCHGAGTLLVLASDITAAGESARFGSPFRARPEANFVLTALTVRLNRAKAWLLRGSVLDAATAYDYGLVNEVVPDADLEETTRTMTGRITAMPLDGIVMSKMLQQPILDASGVGREFDMASFYASGLDVLATQSTGGSDV